MAVSKIKRQPSYLMGTYLAQDLFKENVKWLFSAVAEAK